jgi:hypothetical protein
VSEPTLGKVGREGDEMERLLAAGCTRAEATDLMRERAGLPPLYSTSPPAPTEYQMRQQLLAMGLTPASADKAERTAMDIARQAPCSLAEARVAVLCTMATSAVASMATPRTLRSDMLELQEAARALALAVAAALHLEQAALHLARVVRRVEGHVRDAGRRS